MTICCNVIGLEKHAAKNMLKNVANGGDTVKHLKKCCMRHNFACKKIDSIYFFAALQTQNICCMKHFLLLCKLWDTMQHFQAHAMQHVALYAPGNFA